MDCYNFQRILKISEGISAKYHTWVSNVVTIVALIPQPGKARTKKFEHFVQVFTGKGLTNGLRVHDNNEN